MGWSLAGSGGRTSAELVLGSGEETSEGELRVDCRPLHRSTLSPEDDPCTTFEGQPETVAKFDVDAPEGDHPSVEGDLVAIVGRGPVGTDQQDSVESDKGLKTAGEEAVADPATELRQQSAPEPVIGEARAEPKIEKW